MPRSLPCPKNKRAKHTKENRARRRGRKKLENFVTKVKRRGWGKTAEIVTEIGKTQYLFDVCVHLIYWQTVK